MNFSITYQAESVDEFRELIAEFGNAKSIVKRPTMDKGPFEIEWCNATGKVLRSTREEREAFGDNREAIAESRLNAEKVPTTAPVETNEINYDDGDDFGL